jgi:nitrate reductase NapD
MGGLVFGSLRFKETAGVDTSINISGLLVHARPDKAQAVRARLRGIPGVEVHAVSPEGRLVVTLENASDRDMADTFERVQALPDVLSASLIYHHSEDTEEPSSSAQENQT